MHISVKCFATLQHYTPDGADRYAVADGATVAEVIAGLGIAPAEVKVVFLDGRAAPLDAPVGDGGRVGIFPAVGGG